MTQTTRRRRLIAQRIGALAADNNGRVTAEQVVTDATDTASPLHTEFPWDDAVAAHQHRLDIARRLIREVRIIATVDTISVPVIAYLRDPSADLDGQGYIATPLLRTETTLAREALQYELERALSALHRAREVARALGLDADLMSMRETLLAMRQRLAEAA